MVFFENKKRCIGNIYRARSVLFTFCNQPLKAKLVLVMDCMFLRGWMIVDWQMSSKDNMLEQEFFRTNLDTDTCIHRS